VAMAFSSMGSGELMQSHLSVAPYSAGGTV